MLFLSFGASPRYTRVSLDSHLKPSLEDSLWGNWSSGDWRCLGIYIFLATRVAHRQWLTGMEVQEPSSLVSKFGQHCDAIYVLQSSLQDQTEARLNLNHILYLHLSLPQVSPEVTTLINHLHESPLQAMLLENLT